MLEYCPSCGKTIIFYNVDFNGFNHCPECGELIDNESKFLTFIKPVNGVTHEVCKVCGRKLNTLESKYIGIGPKCLRRLESIKKEQNKLF